MTLIRCELHKAPSIYKDVRGFIYIGLFIFRPHHPQILNPQV